MSQPSDADTSTTTSASISPELTWPEQAATAIVEARRTIKQLIDSPAAAEHQAPENTGELFGKLKENLERLAETPEFLSACPESLALLVGYKGALALFLMFAKHYMLRNQIDLSKQGLRCIDSALSMALEKLPVVILPVDAGT